MTANNALTNRPMQGRDVLPKPLAFVASKRGACRAHLYMYPGHCPVFYKHLNAFQMPF